MLVLDGGRDRGEWAGLFFPWPLPPGLFGEDAARGWGAGFGKEVSDWWMERTLLICCF